MKRPLDKIKEKMYLPYLHSMPSFDFCSTGEIFVNVYILIEFINLNQSNKKRIQINIKLLKKKRFDLRF